MQNILLCLLLAISISANSQKYFLFIGTYTGSGSKGIYVYSFNAATGTAEWLSNTEGVVNPSYLAIAPGGTYIYACTETRTADAGGLSAFKFNREKGSLTFLNKQSSGGDNPAYISIHNSGKWVIAGNYSGGNLSAFSVNANGSLRPYSQLIQHTGNSINKQRQESPHVHATVFSPSGDYLFAPDLGIDKVMIYKFNAKTQKPLQPATVPFKSTEPGSGPRHFIFHPNKKWAYLIQEMAGEVVAYDVKNGKLNSMQQIATHPDTLHESFGSADIHVSPDGKFLYTSNRGNENNLAIFAINQINGMLSLKGYQSTMGVQPRNFVIDPSGKYLLAANQKTGNIVIFKRDKKTGLLQYTGEQIKVPQPVCLKMMK
jgi:6-phosphogluconolactonase